MVLATEHGLITATRKEQNIFSNKFKYHLLPIARIIAAGETAERMNSNKFEKYCEKLVAAFKDEKDAAKIFGKATNAIDSVLGGNYGRDKAKDAALFSTVAAGLTKT